jgi:hypothetical protein
MSTPRDSFDELRLPFIFIPDGAPEPPEAAAFRAAHPQWISLRATLILRPAGATEAVNEAASALALNDERLDGRHSSRPRDGDDQNGQDDDRNGRYVAGHPEQWIGPPSVGSGQCVPLVQKATGAPLTKEWRRGALVRGDLALRPGTAIATFDEDGHYGNHTDGRSHAAIYLGQDEKGIWVIDQWVNRDSGVHMPSRRQIQFDETRRPDNNGNRYHVIR